MTGNLTRREREIVALICQGLNNSEIAERLVISPHTVKNHVHAILTKMGLRSRYRLIAMMNHQIQDAV